MEKQLVIFKLENEEFGIDIASVEGIIKLQDITRIPQGPTYMEGITNLRGNVLPVINLALRLGLSAQEKTRESRIVVALTGDVKVGMVVSAVSEVLTIDDGVIEPSPRMVNTIDTEYIVGVAKIDARLVILLDLAKVLTTEEKIQVTGVFGDKG